MSMRVSRNMGPYGTVPLGLYAWKEFLKATGGVKNWTVVMSGDGLVAYSAAADIITSGASGAGGLDNTTAWFVLEDPDSNRQILVKRDAVAYRFEFWYSKTGAFAGGSATLRPTAADEETMMQNRVISYTGFPSSGSYYMNIVAEGDAPDGDVYPFWCIMRYTGTGNPFGSIVMDCVDDSLSPAADSDKAMMWTSGNQVLNAISGGYLSYSNTNGYMSGYMRYGEANEEWWSLGYMTYDSDGALKVPGALAANPEDAKYGVLPSFVVRTGGVTNGIKGQANLHRWKPTAFNYGDIVYDGTDYFLVVDDCMFRGWPDSTGPTI